LQGTVRWTATGSLEADVHTRKLDVAPPGSVLSGQWATSTDEELRHLMEDDADDSEVVLTVFGTDHVADQPACSSSEVDPLDAMLQDLGLGPNGEELSPPIATGPWTMLDMDPADD